MNTQDFTVEVVPLKAFCFTADEAGIHHRRCREETLLFSGNEQKERAVFPMDPTKALL